MQYILIRSSEFEKFVLAHFLKSRLRYLKDDNDAAHSVDKQFIYLCVFQDLHEAFFLKVESNHGVLPKLTFMNALPTFCLNNGLVYLDLDQWSPREKPGTTGGSTVWHPRVARGAIHSSKKWRFALALVKCNAFWKRVMNSRIRTPFYVIYSS